VNPQPTFDAVTVGATVCAAEFGPLTIDDTVRWAASQEIWERLHFDREFAREHSGQRTFIASGAYRQALLARMLTDWLGPRGVLRKLRVRHTAPTLEGDVMRFAATVVEKSADAGDPWVACDVAGTNQDDVTIVAAHAVVTLPTAAGR
jgi:acyl dehydratase